MLLIGTKKIGMVLVEWVPFCFISIVGNHRENILRGHFQNPWGLIF